MNVNLGLVSFVAALLFAALIILVFVFWSLDFWSNRMLELDG
jgi:hypothetical protein